MINSFFLLSVHGTIIIEKHWRSVISRAIVDQFLSEIAKNTDPLEVLPVIPFSKMYLVHVQRDGLIYLAIITSEVQPLLVIEFLHRMADIFKDYFGEVNESSIKENFVTVYQLLEEMMDNGFPLTTEPNILKEVILPPTILNRVVNAVSGGSNVSTNLPSNMSAIPWRKTGIKYNNNEIYFDIVEEFDAIVDQNGQIISSEIKGEINCNCRLSGMPDLIMSFANPRILDDVSFHPCIRIARFERDRVLSFVPPDGSFKLLNYRVNTGTNAQLPIAVRPVISFMNSSGKIEVTVRSMATGGKPLEGIMIHIPLPPAVLTANISVNYGQYEFDMTTKLIKWNLNRMAQNKIPILTGSIVLQSASSIEGQPILLADFKINMYAASGLKVDSLLVTGENYKPYKGVRAITKAGRFQIRS